MNNRRTLEALILADVLVSVLSAVWDAVLGRILPADLRGAVASGTAGWTLPANLSLALWIGVCAGTVLSWIGLANLLRVARPLYAASWIGYLALAALRGTGVGSPIGSALDLLAGLVGGMILAVVYFSDLSAQFRPLGPASRQPLPAGLRAISFVGGEPALPGTEPLPPPAQGQPGRLVPVG